MESGQAPGRTYYAFVIEKIQLEEGKGILGRRGPEGKDKESLADHDPPLQTS